MRRKDKETPSETAKDILARGEYGVLSTVGVDGMPYGVPISYIFHDEALYFHCAKDVGLKLENIRHRNTVCFTVVATAHVIQNKFTTAYESTIVTGEAVEIFEGQKEIISLFVKKYTPDFLEESVAYIEDMIDKISFFKISISNISGKCQPES